LAFKFERVGLATTEHDDLGRAGDHTKAREDGRLNLCCSFEFRRDASVHLLITELRCANLFQCGASPHFVSAWPYLLTYLSRAGYSLERSHHGFENHPSYHIHRHEPSVHCKRSRRYRWREERGAAGELAAAPVGAVVGGALGAPVGAVDGILGVEKRLRFRQYVACKHHP
jgi:hypothetical protein